MEKEGLVGGGRVVGGGGVVGGERYMFHFSIYVSIFSYRFYNITARLVARFNMLNNSLYKNPNTDFVI